MQYAGKLSGRIRSSVVDAQFEFIFGQFGQSSFWAIDGKPCVEVQLTDSKLDVVDNFVYLRDCICPGGGCELATIKRCRSARGNLENYYPYLLVKQFL